jgi:hypothetical protein
MLKCCLLRHMNLIPFLGQSLLELLQFVIARLMSSLKPGGTFFFFFLFLPSHILLFPGASKRRLNIIERT